jgi:hypothetical protein
MSRRLLVPLIAPFTALALAVPAQAVTASAPSADAHHPVVAKKKRLGKKSDHTWLFGGRKRISWKTCKPLTYRLNTLEAGPGDRKTLKKSLKKITQASGYRFKYVGKTKQKPQSGSHNPRGTDIVIAWLDKSKTNMIPNDNVLGVGGAFTDGRHSRLFDGRLVLNTPILDQLPDGFGTGNATGYLGTRGAVIMHELAHVMGLGHAREESQIMYPSVTYKKAKWGAGDYQGLKQLGNGRGKCGGKKHKGKHHRETLDRSTAVSSFLPAEAVYAE